MRLFLLRKAFDAWKRQSRSWEKTHEPLIRKVSKHRDKHLRQTIKSWLWSASTKKVKRRLKRISNVCKSNWRRKIKTLSTMTTVSHARWKLNRVKPPNKSLLTLLKYWLSVSIRQSTRMLKRSAYLISTLEMPKLSRRLLKRLWRPQESITLMRLSLPLSKLKSKTFSFSTTLTSWTKRMTNLKNHQPTMISRFNSTRSSVGSI